MGWSSFWHKRALRAAERRRSRFGQRPPPRIALRLRKSPDTLGPGASLALALYVLVGSPRQTVQLLWRYFTDRDTPNRRRRIEGLASELESCVSRDCRVLKGYFERRLYSRDLARVPSFLEKILHRTTPTLVAQPRTEEDIAAVLRFATRHRLPVFPRGVASSALGGAVPTMNGISLDLSALRTIREIDEENRTARVQTGVRWADLAERVRPLGLAIRSSPSSRFSTVGGWAAGGGLGIESYRSGHFSDAIEAVRVVLPDGTVAEHTRGDPALGTFLGTEGQFGVISELRVRLRDAPTFSRPVLHLFDDAAAAFVFLGKVADAGIRPSHMAYYDPGRLAEENVDFRDRTGRSEDLVPTRHGVLLHFDDREEERAFRDGPGAGAGADSQHAAASVLWAERFFPLKFQRLGPGMLAAEVVLPRKRVPAFLEKARKLAVRFGSVPAFEVFVSRPRRQGGEDETRDCVVLGTFRCDPRHRIDYFLRLLLVQLLVRQGVRMGGRPYGIGIWNSPFLHKGIPMDVRRELVRRKLDLDPHLLLNPRKFFRVRTRFFNVPGLLFASPVFNASLALLHALSPLVGLAARILGEEPAHTWTVPGPEEDGGRRILRESALRCTFCGACVSTCPAYALTGDERATGRGKLRLGETLAGSREFDRNDAASVFQCLHCGLCAEVCQASLPLLDCYAALEAWIEREMGRPADAVERFAARVDENRAAVTATFGLSAPEWFRPDGVHPLPWAKRFPQEVADE